MRRDYKVVNGLVKGSDEDIDRNMRYGFLFFAGVMMIAIPGVVIYLLYTSLWHRPLRFRNDPEEFIGLALMLFIIISIPLIISHVVTNSR